MTAADSSSCSLEYCNRPAVGARRVSDQRVIHFCVSHEKRAGHLPFLVPATAPRCTAGACTKGAGKGRGIRRPTPGLCVYHAKLCAPWKGLVAYAATLSSSQTAEALRAAGSAGKAESTRKTETSDPPYPIPGSLSEQERDLDWAAVGVPYWQMKCKLTGTTHKVYNLSGLLARVRSQYKPENVLISYNGKTWTELSRIPDLVRFRLEVHRRLRETQATRELVGARRRLADEPAELKRQIQNARRVLLRLGAPDNDQLQLDELILVTVRTLTTPAADMKALTDELLAATRRRQESV